MLGPDEADGLLVWFDVGFRGSEQAPTERRVELSTGPAGATDLFYFVFGDGEGRRAGDESEGLDREVL